MTETSLSTAGDSLERHARFAAALREAARDHYRFQAIVNATSDGLLLYDTDRCIIAANRQSAELLGFAYEQLLHEELDALEFDLQSRTALPAQYRERLNRHFADPWGVTDDLLELERPRRRVIRRHSEPMVEDGRVTGRVFTYTDITAETDLERMKSEFVSMASHELRTPLTSVHAALQLALAGSGHLMSAEDREMLEISVRSTSRLVSLINDLLDLSKIEAGRMPMALAPLAAADLLEETARVMQGLASTRRIAIATSASSGLPRILGDHDHLLRVLTNLTSNAIKYSPKDSRVTLAAQPGPHALQMSVADEGPGVPDDQIDRLFRPFSRVGAQERQITGGTGLGLALSRAIVESHGGRIWAERAEPRGMRVVFELPFADPAAARSGHA